MSALDSDLDMSVLENMDFSVGCMGIQITEANQIKFSTRGTCPNPAKFYKYENHCPALKIRCTDCMNVDIDWFARHLGYIVRCSGDLNCEYKYLLLPRYLPKYYEL